MLAVIIIFQAVSDCSSDAAIVTITPEVADAIVEAHNERRNQQALGKTPHYKSAERMATMTWDQDLADLAELNVRTCAFAHDPCMNTEKYPLVGQNIAMSIATEGMDMGSDAKALSGLAGGFFDSEHGNGQYWGWMKFINKFNMPPEDDMSRQIGHFTQLVRDEAVAVGCAASRFSMDYDGKPGTATVMTCNYSRGNPYENEKVYSHGPTASKCTTGPNTKYPGLCSESEVYEEPTIQW